MKRKWNLLIHSTLLASAALAGCSGDEETIVAERTATLPVYRVSASGTNAIAADRLAAALKLGTNSLDSSGAVLRSDGSIRFHDVSRFHELPTKALETPAVDPAKDETGKAVAIPATAVDLDALKALRPISQAEALARVEAAFKAAGLSPRGEAKLSHATFESRNTKGELIASVDIDTQVAYEQRLDGLRLIGPGAKVKVVFDPMGAVTQVMYAAQQLERAEEVAVVPKAKASELCTRALGGGAGLRVEAELVYYAPPLSQKATRIFPHYSCGGTRVVDGQKIEVRRQLVPAIEDAPVASIHVTVQDSDVRAEGFATGGTAPYTFTWGSSSKSLDRTSADSSTIEYTVSSRSPKQVDEAVSLLVTDANGLTFRAAERVSVRPLVVGEATSPIQTVGGTPFGTVGTEWIGTCGGLGGSAGNAGGFVNRFQASGITAQFNWGEYNAWEMDFKDPAFGGQDTSSVDAVDLTFYTGHANGDGFTFCSNMHDGMLTYNDARWGNSNMEWLVIAACGPLQETWGGSSWVDRWYRAFDGLHILMGYATVSYDNEIEGNNFADYLLRYYSLPVRDAWINAAMDAQPSSDVIWAEMGVWGPNWTLPNYDEYFWGMGNVGPDVRGTDIWAYWRISGGS